MPDRELEEQEQAEMRVIDAHSHIASVEHIPKSFIEGAVANMVAAFEAQGLPVTSRKLTDMFLQKMQDPLCDELVAEMDAAGVEKTVLLVADFTYALKDCALTIEESLRKHRAVLERHPGRFEVFGGVDPRWGKDGLALFERSVVEYGFRGLKLYPPCGYSPSDRALFPFYEICAQHRIPVLMHTGPTSAALSFSTSNPWLVDEAAHTFPTVNFILAHGSVNFTDECAMMCRFRPNVFLDVSAFQTLSQLGMEVALKRTFTQGINHKVLFGTDWPVFRMQGDQKTFVEFATAEGGPMDDLNDSEKCLILHGNIERILSKRDKKD